MAKPAVTVRRMYSPSSEPPLVVPSGCRRGPYDSSQSPIASTTDRRMNTVTPQARRNMLPRSISPESRSHRSWVGRPSSSQQIPDTPPQSGCSSKTVATRLRVSGGYQQSSSARTIKSAVECRRPTLHARLTPGSERRCRIETSQCLAMSSAIRASGFWSTTITRISPSQLWAATEMRSRFSSTVLPSVGTRTSIDSTADTGRGWYFVRWSADRCGS